MINIKIECLLLQHLRLSIILIIEHICTQFTVVTVIFD